MQKQKLDALLISRAYPPEGGGVASHVYYLADALSKITLSRMDPRKTCNVHVLTTGAQRVVHEGAPPNYTVHRLHGKQSHFSPYGDVPVGEAVSYALDHWKKIEADVIHAHDFESVQIGLMLKAALRVPLIVTVHKAPKEWDKTLPRRDIKDCFLEVMLRFDIADRVVAPSKAYYRRLLDQGFSQDKVKLIPHGVPIAWLSAFSDSHEVLERFQVETEHELVLCPNRLDPHKGIETFIEAARLLKQQFPDRKLLFVVAGAGVDRYRKKLQQQTKGMSSFLRLGRSDNRDTALKEMATLYRRAKVVVVPSRREGFGQVVLEAFVFHKPVVAANTGGIPDVVDPGETGLLFHRDEPEDLAIQVRKLLEDDGLCEDLAWRAYSRLTRDFDAARMAEDYCRLYKRVSGITITKTRK